MDQEPGKGQNFKIKQNCCYPELIKFITEDYFHKYANNINDKEYQNRNNLQELLQCQVVYRSTRQFLRNKFKIPSLTFADLLFFAIRLAA